MDIALPTSILPAIQSATKLFLTGPYGSGKTEAGVERLRWLLRQERVRGDDILILVPQRTLGEPYRQALRGARAPIGAPVTITTVARLAGDAVELYWPLLAPHAGFTDPHKEPTFLNLETAQYHMDALVEKSLATGEFDAMRVVRSRIISQVLDNLNKSALHGFTIDETYARLELAVPPGELRTGQINALRAARRISHEFRELCLTRSLIDFSLRIELFNRHILANESGSLWARTHLLRRHRHLIFDNLEEDTATAHDLVAAWLPHLDSALLIHDEDAGFRVILGADPQSAQQLAAQCRQTLRLQSAPPPAIRAATDAVTHAVRTRGQPPPAPPHDRRDEVGDTPSLFRLPERTFRYYPQMIRWVVEQTADLITQQGVAPGDIAIIAPYVSDALRFTLQHELSTRGITSTTHRPSRALQDEPAARALLTLAALAHPDWDIRPPAADVILTLQHCIARLDPLRAHLLCQIVYPSQRRRIELTRFAEIVPAMQSRITFAAGEAYDILRDWLYGYRAAGQIVPLDQFFSRLFGEVLSQPRFGFHDNIDAARVAKQLVESARNFRWALEEAEGAEAALNTSLAVRLGKSYLELVNSGALGALYIAGWQADDNAVYISPASTFLMRNRTAEVQFWLDIGSTGWWERLYQPLTHPYVLARSWPSHQPWTDLDEYHTRQDTLRRLLLGLIRRTRQAVYLGISEIGEGGMEQRGALLNLINQLILQQRRDGLE